MINFLNRSDANQNQVVAARTHDGITVYVTSWQLVTLIDSATGYEAAVRAVSHRVTTADFAALRPARGIRCFVAECGDDTNHEFGTAWEALEYALADLREVRV